jgi:hypothetical protein
VYINQPVPYDESASSLVDCYTISKVGKNIPDIHETHFWDSLENPVPVMSFDLASGQP